MASVQCYKPSEKTSCHQEHQNHSFGHKVSEKASSTFLGHGGSHHNHGQTQTAKCYGQTETYYRDHRVEKTHSHNSNTQGHHPHHTMSHKSCQNQCMKQTHDHQAQNHASGTMTCQGKTNRHGSTKRRGFLQKIKDGISRDNSDSDNGSSSSSSSSSSSDSESDDEKCGTRKN